MATKIEWANETWNYIVGCTKVSPGCSECYAEKMAFRIAAMEAADPNMRSLKYLSVMKDHNWNGNVYFDEPSLEKPFKWKKPKMIFVCSMGDLFHEQVPFEWIDKGMNVIRWTPQHTYLFLTKRPERMLEYFTKYVHEKYTFDNGNTLDNLWLGVTAENQEQANKRIPYLLRIPAVKRFVSIEPMLGSVDLGKIRVDDKLEYNCLNGSFTIAPGHKLYLSNKYVERKIDWVICGGMSGTDKYPLNPEWVRSLQKQCEVSKVPFLFKQWGGRNKLRNGRTLNGKIYNEYPL